MLEQQNYNIPYYYMSNINDSEYLESLELYYSERLKASLKKKFRVCRGCSSEKKFINHNGKLKNCFKLIKEAAKAGVDAVKFQNWKAEDFISDKKQKFKYKSKGKIISEPFYDLYKRNELPTADFSFYSNVNDLKNGIKEGKVEFPCVWKKTKFGYDGFGVKILKSIEDLNDIPESEMIIEKLIPFEKEIAVIIARNSKGKIKNFDVVEMEFNEISNQVEFVISPSNISEEIKKNAIEIAIETAEQFNLIGLLAVEMFLTEDNQILINEVAPRPHNSGHLTLDACNTSQFEQHIRAILGLELGDVSQKGNAIMLNLVGEENSFGKVIYSNLDNALNDDSSYVHIYGKEETRPNRKMGHITIICDNFEDAYTKAKNFKNTIKVKSINNG